MKLDRLLTTLLALSLLVGLGSCGSEPGPTEVPGQAVTPPQYLLDTDLDEDDGEEDGDEDTELLECEPLEYATATATIGPAGGMLQIGPHTLYVVPEALSEPVTITGEAPSSTVRSVSFEPEGLQFAHPVYLTLDYEDCEGLDEVLPKTIVYVDDDLTILEYLLSWDSQDDEKVTGRLDHFSQYAVAW